MCDECRDNVEVGDRAEGVENVAEIEEKNGEIHKELSGRTKRISDEEGLNTLRRVFILIGRIPTQKEYNELNLLPNYGWYNRRFKKHFDEIFIEANKDRYNYKKYDKNTKDKIEEILLQNPNIKFKVCSHCGRYLPLDIYFYCKQDEGKNGFTAKCKDCERQLYYEEKKGEAGVYKIINKINNKIYVGSSVGLIARETEHFITLKNKTHANRHLQRAFNKYGEENFEFQIIEIVDDKEKLLEREQYWIDKLNVCDKNIGYNIAPIAGNCLGIKKTDEQRKKMSERGKGRKLSEEAKRKIGEKSRGRHHTIESKQKLRRSHIGIPLSEETKKKLSEAHKGRTSNRKGIPLSEETKQKLSDSHKDIFLGENNPFAILTEKDVIIIKLLLKMNVKGVGKLFDVSKSTISSIKNNRNWSQLLLENYTDDEVNNTIQEYMNKNNTLYQCFQGYSYKNQCN